MTEPSCLDELPPSLREELLSLGAWIRDGLLQGEACRYSLHLVSSEKTRLSDYRFDRVKNSIISRTHAHTDRQSDFLGFLLKPKIIKHGTVRLLGQFLKFYVLPTLSFIIFCSVE